MDIEGIRDYHMRRATVELDLAYRADTWAVMEAHLKLSALHMARLREVVGSESKIVTSEVRPFVGGAGMAFA